MYMMVLWSTYKKCYLNYLILIFLRFYYLNIIIKNVHIELHIISYGKTS